MEIKFKNNSYIKVINSGEVKRPDVIRGHRLTEFEYNRMIFREQTNAEDNVDNMSKVIKYFRKYPDKFAEEMLGIKLLPYQKLLLKTFKSRRNK